MADLDFGKIKLYPGNYDFWLESSQLATKLQSNANAKKEEQIKELQDFIARFSANASKSKQATSRKKMLEKITLEDIQPSSRRYPFIAFKPEREIGNDLLRVDDVSVTIDGKKVLDKITFSLNKEDKTAFVAADDIATTALIRVIMGDLEPDTGKVTWGVTTSQSYLPKDTTKDFDSDLTIIDWLRQYASKEQDDNTFLRGFLGRMLFTADEVNKEVRVLSGGEKVRVMLSKLMLAHANVLVLDDPTNHLDLESITALNDGLKNYQGAMIFASHDHQFIDSLANRIIAISGKGMVDRADTTYDEFLENKDVRKQMDELFAQD
jgi:ATPase subunit of ABC transporter with duplicated ATPase domains